MSMNEEDIKKMVGGDEDIAEVLSLFYNTYKDGQPIIDKLEDMLRAEMVKANLGAHNLFAILSMFSGRIIALFRGALKMKDEDVIKAFEDTFQICYKTYCMQQDELLKKVGMTMDGVDERVREIDDKIKQFEASHKSLRGMMDKYPEMNKEPGYHENLENLEKKIEILKQERSILQKHFPTEIN